MPKKIRTLDDDVKSLLTKKKKINPMQKISGMKKEHIIKNHDELLKEIHRDLNTLSEKKFFPKEGEVLVCDDTHSFPPFHSKIDDMYLSETFKEAPPGMIVVGDDFIDHPKIIETGMKEYEGIVIKPEGGLNKNGERTITKLKPVEKIPNPDSQEYEDMISFMRADLECGMRYSRIIETVRARMKEDGKDLNEEFRKWKEKKDANFEKFRI